MVNSLSPNSKTVIKYARGHDFLAFSDFSNTQEGRNHVPFHFSSKVRSYAKSHFFSSGQPIPKKITPVQSMKSEKLHRNQSNRSVPQNHCEVSFNKE
jgi:hypothetical protein